MNKIVLVSPKGQIFPFEKGLAKTEGFKRHILIPVPEESHKAIWRQCRDFLLDLLSNGPVPATQVIDCAILVGYAPSTIRQVKERSGIVSHYTGKPFHAGIWMWELPEEEKPYQPSDEAINAARERVHALLRK